MISDIGNGGKRGIIAALGLVVFVLVAAFGAYWLYGTAAEKQAIYEAIAKNGAENYTARRDLLIQQQCNALLGSDKTNCIAKQNEVARQGYRNEYGLEAQRITATWTAHMGVAAIIGMAASLIGVGLIFVTFQATRTANEIAQKSHVAQNRAWLVVNMVEADWRYTINDETLEIFGDVHFIVKNTGHSAATNIWTRTAVGDPNGIWGTMLKADETPLALECLPPEGTRLVGEHFSASIPLVKKRNFLNPQMACIQITYDGGGVEQFVTECILTISSGADNAEHGWDLDKFTVYPDHSILMDAYGHFGYFRTVT